MPESAVESEGVLTYEMRRNTDGFLIAQFVMQPGHQLDFDQPSRFRNLHPGWPTGCHWRLLKNGRVAAQWPCSTKSDRADDEDEADDEDHLQSVAELFHATLFGAFGSELITEEGSVIAVQALLAAGWTPPNHKEPSVTTTTTWFVPLPSAGYASLHDLTGAARSPRLALTGGTATFTWDDPEPRTCQARVWVDGLCVYESDWRTMNRGDTYLLRFAE